MILKHNIKIFTSNFIKKNININIKNWKNSINTRFAPEAGGFLHLGHIKSILLNIEISKIYNGICFLRIDDTNPNKNKFYYKNLILKNIKFFNIFKKNFFKKKSYTSNYFNKLFQYAEFLIKKNYKKKISLKLKKIRDMKNGKFKEKKIFFEINILNNFIKIYRILYKKHFRLKYIWFIYPLYDYSNILVDKIENIKYSLCTLEFIKNRLIFNLIKKIIFIKIIPIQIEFAKLNFKKNFTSKRLISLLIKKKYIKNHKDKRLLTISSFKGLNINKNLLISFCKKIGISKINKNFSKKSIFINIKYKKEFFFIKKFIILIIKNFEINKIEKFYSEKKKVFFSKILILEKNTFKKNENFKIKIKKNKKFYLKYTNYNIIIKSKFKIKFITFLNCIVLKKKKKNYKNINWINKLYKKRFILNINGNLINNKLKKKINFNYKSNKKCIIFTLISNFSIKSFFEIKMIKSFELIYLIKNKKKKFIKSKIYQIL